MKRELVLGRIGLRRLARGLDRGLVIEPVAVTLGRLLSRRRHGAPIEVRIDAGRLAQILTIENMGLDKRLRNYVLSRAGDRKRADGANNAAETGIAHSWVTRIQVDF